MERNIARISVSIATTALLTGCIFQPEPKVVQGDPYPAPGAKTQEERRDEGAPKVEAAPSASALDLTVTQPTECRDKTPMVRDIKTERHTNRTEQVINGGSALLFGGIGALVLAAPVCSPSPNSGSTSGSNSTNSGSGCLSDRDTGNVLGGILVGTAALFGAAFVYNVIRAHDSQDTVPVQAAPTWKACDSKPLANTAVNLKFADGQQLQATTDSTGHARFQLSSVRMTEDLLRPGVATVLAAGQETRVSLVAWPAYKELQQRLAILAQQSRQRCEDTCNSKEAACMATFHNEQCLWGHDDCVKKCVAQAVATAHTSTPAEHIESVSDALTRLETAVTAAEHLLPILERAREPWGEPALAQIMPLADALHIMRDAGMFVGTHPLDAPQEARANTILPRMKQVNERTAALVPRVQRAVEIYKRQRNAQALAVLQSLSSGTGGGASTADASHEREARSEDGQKRQDEERTKRDRYQTCLTEQNQCYQQCVANKPSSQDPGCPGNMWQPCLDRYKACMGER